MVKQHRSFLYWLQIMRVRNAHIDIDISQWYLLPFAQGSKKKYSLFFLCFLFHVRARGDVALNKSKEAINSLQGTHSIHYTN